MILTTSSADCTSAAVALKGRYFVCSTTSSGFSKSSLNLPSFGTPPASPTIVTVCTSLTEGTMGTFVGPWMTCSSQAGLAVAAPAEDADARNAARATRMTAARERLLRTRAGMRPVSPLLPLFSLARLLIPWILPLWSLFPRTKYRLPVKYANTAAIGSTRWPRGRTGEAAAGGLRGAAQAGGGGGAGGAAGRRGGRAGGAPRRGGGPRGGGEKKGEARPGESRAAPRSGAGV